MTLLSYQLMPYLAFPASTFHPSPLTSWRYGFLLPLDNFWSFGCFRYALSLLSGFNKGCCFGLSLLPHWQIQRGWDPIPATSYLVLNIISGSEWQSDWGIVGVAGGYGHGGSVQRLPNQQAHQAVSTGRAQWRHNRWRWWWWKQWLRYKSSIFKARISYLSHSLIKFVIILKTFSDKLFESLSRIFVKVKYLDFFFLFFQSAQL